MKIENTDDFFYSIRNDCLRLIYQKKVDLDMLAFECDMTTKKLVKIFDKKNNDLLIYLKVYNTLVEW